MNIRHTLRTLAWGLLLLGSGLAAAAAPPRQSWDPLRELPVFHDGRIMPLDTLARESVSVVTGRESPRLGLVGEVFPGDQEVSSDQPARVLAPQQVAKYRNQAPYREAFRLFPQGKSRKFDPVELLFSWMIEPRRWQHVPFILCEHEELRRALHLPVLGPDGGHLKYVSPAFLAESKEFPDLVEKMFQQRREAAEKNEPLRGLSHLVQELYQRYILFRRLSATPETPVSDSVAETFGEKFQQARRHWALLHQLVGEETLQQALGIADPLKQAETPMVRLFQFVQARMVIPRLVDREVETLREAMQQVHQQLAAHAKREVKAENQEVQQRNENARRLLQRMADHARGVLEAADQMQIAVYRNRLPVRVVPALVPEALEADRPGMPPSPWLDLMTLVHAPERVLRLQGYPMEEVRRVRKAFQEFAAVAQQGTASVDAALFRKRAVRLVEALDALGTAINPLRKDLPLKELDHDQLTYTAYPDRNDLSWGSSWRKVVSEVRYNRVAPFRWAWVVAFLGTVCYAMSFGRLRRWMFWLGSAVMLFSVVWGIYGFYLRVAITGWAPVTNMYETVIYVALVVAILGLWFTFLPVFWPGVSRLWQLTALPLTSQGREEFARQWRQRPQVAWLRVVLWAIRLAMALWIFDLLSLRGIGGSYDAPMPLWPRGGENWEWSVNLLLVWSASVIVVGTSMWAVPRALLALVLGLPWGAVLSFRQDPRRRQETMAQVYRRLPFSVSAAAVSFILFLVAWWSPVMDDGFDSLSPVLRNNFWLTVHVLTIVTSYGAGALAWVMAVLAMGYYLFGKYRDVEPTRKRPGHAPASQQAGEPVEAFRRPPEQTAALANYIYKSFQVAVLLLAAGTILGGLWADVSWGRFWGWDPKEIWALISLLVYLVILHGRYVGMFGNFGMAVGAMAGMTAIAFSWFGVNFILGAGLHSYGFVDEGVLTAAVVFGVLGLGWLLAIAAWIRYMGEMDKADVHSPQDDALAGA